MRPNRRVSAVYRTSLPRWKMAEDFAEARGEGSREKAKLFRYSFFFLCVFVLYSYFYSNFQCDFIPSINFVRFLMSCFKYLNERPRILWKGWAAGEVASWMNFLRNFWNDVNNLNIYIFLIIEISYTRMILRTKFSFNPFRNCVSGKGLIERKKERLLSFVDDQSWFI